MAAHVPTGGEAGFAGTQCGDEGDEDATLDARDPGREKTGGEESSEDVEDARESGRVGRAARATALAAASAAAFLARL